MIWRDSRERAAACNAILRGVRIGPCFDGERGDLTPLGFFVAWASSSRVHRRRPEVDA